MRNCGQCAHYRATRLHGFICGKTGKSTGYLQEKPCFELKTNQNETKMEEELTQTTTEKTKVCKKCGRSLPVTEFNKHSKTADRLQPYCKECQHKAIAERRAKKKGDATRGKATKEIQEVVPPMVFLITATDREILQELAKRGYTGTLTKTVTFTI